MQALPSVPSLQVNNLGQRDMPVIINFWVPIELKGDAVWTVMVSHPQVHDCPGSAADALGFVTCVTYESPMLWLKSASPLAF